MLITCKKCGKEMLSEADPYALIPVHEGVEYNCGCYFVNKKLLTVSAMAMNGVMANETFWSFHDTKANSFNAVAKYSVQVAKALLKELEGDGEGCTI